MKSPRKNLKARSAVVSRKSSPSSPVWTSAKDVFKSPKSPSPVRRVTRRTSVYQSRAKSSNTGNFKMPLPKMTSPPGVKTRARRSSIYQKGGGRLISPPKPTRTRRTSIYVSSKSKPETVNVFSKVWATPVRQPEVVAEKSPVKKAGAKTLSPPKTDKAPKSTDVSASIISGSKTEAPRSASPKKTFKTPKAVNKSKASESKAETPGISSSPKKSVKTPKSVNRARKTVESETNTPKQLEQIQHKTPGSDKKRSPARATPKQRNTQHKTPASGKKLSSARATPKQRNTQHKTPASGKKLSPARATPKQRNTPRPKSAKKSPKPTAGRKSLPGNKVKAAAQPLLVTSTPTKSVEQITGKSFYSTPGETPIPSQRTDDVFVFSAKPVKSAKKSLKKSVHITPVETPQNKSKTPKRMPTRKTPAVKRSRQNDLIDSDVSLAPSPPAKKVKTTPRARTVKSVKRSVKKLSTVDTQDTREKLKLSPVEMTSVLKSVAQTEKRRASKSPSPRRAKRAKISSTEMQTPRVIKTVKRTSPKKLAEIVSVSQNTNNNAESDVSMVNTTLLNDTINTDSRSSRCIIL